jgi:hypothetical protein
MAAYVDGARHLSEVWPCCGCEARRQCILRKKRLAHCSESSSGSCFVLGVGGWVGWDVDAKVCDDLVGGAAAVARLEGREGFDLGVVSIERYVLSARTCIWLLLEHGGDGGLWELCYAAVSLAVLTTLYTPMLTFFAGAGQPMTQWGRNSTSVSTALSSSEVEESSPLVLMSDEVSASVCDTFPAACVSVSLRGFVSLGFSLRFLPAAAASPSGLPLRRPDRHRGPSNPNTWIP